MKLSENVTGFQHLGLPVSDIEKSITFYTKLGFEVQSRWELKENGGTTRVAFIEQKGLCLELYQPAGGFESGRGETGPVDHFALNVSDVDAAFGEVEALGLATLSEEPIYLPLQNNGIRYFVVPGPDGEKMEFNQIL